ncbi:hypothetical protein J6590_015938 [Homalodisca vitripennis]|nr:hypothetical protein J6590_015938 [Homalodisca vitripennis]
MPLAGKNEAVSPPNGRQAARHRFATSVSAQVHSDTAPSVTCVVTDLPCRAHLSPTAPP